MYKNLLKTAILAANKASEISAHFLQDAGIVSLEGKDIKTIADTEMNKVIIQILTETGIPILSEEIKFPESVLPELLWVIDPLDGTLNFSRKFPVASVSIGLLQNQKPVIGVIKDIFSDNLFYAADGMGAWLNQEQIKVSSVTKINEAVLTTGFPSGSKLVSSEILELLNSILDFKKIRMIGAASLMLSYVAQGVFDVYYENDIYLWDVAAGLCIVKEAGGVYYLNKNEGYHKYRVLASNTGIFDNVKEKFVIE